MKIRRVFELAVVLAALAFTPSAFADAAALKQSADDAYDAHRYDDAARAYEASWSEKHDPSVLYNLARTYEALGRHPEALERLQRFADSAPLELRKKVPKLDGMLAVYRTRVATLEVSANVVGARIVVRNSIVGETRERSATFKVNAGPCTIEVAKDGYRSWANELTLEGGVVTEIDARLEKKDVVRISQPAAPAATESPIYTTWWFWAGTGAVVLITSVAIFAALTIERDAPPGTIGTVTGPLVTF